MTELSAALTESRARGSELQAQLLASLRDRLELKAQLQQLTALLQAEQQLRARERENIEARERQL